MADRQQNVPERGTNSLVNHIVNHKIDVGLLITRLATIFFACGYFLPIFGTSPYQAYYKVMIANAATSALRLHQRMPRIQLTREFLAQVMMEDSAHYLFYSIIFLYTNPVTIAILPVLLFSILHSASYTLTLLDVVGQNSGWVARLLISLVEMQSRNILRMAAFTEIFLMPIVIFLIFSGRGNILTPFLYYRFVSLRYSSRRNPYSRMMFRELRLAMEEASSSPRVPNAVRNMLFKVIYFISNLAPDANHHQQ